MPGSDDVLIRSAWRDLVAGSSTFQTSVGEPGNPAGAEDHTYYGELGNQVTLPLALLLPLEDTPSEHRGTGLFLTTGRLRFRLVRAVANVDVDGRGELDDYEKSADDFDTWASLVVAEMRALSETEGLLVRSIEPDGAIEFSRPERRAWWRAKSRSAFAFRDFTLTFGLETGG